MRNTLVYRITKEEVLIAIHAAMLNEDEDDDGVGSINMYILGKVYDVMNRDFCESDFNEEGT